MFDYRPELSGGSYYPENHQAQLANSFIPMLQHPSQLVAPMPVPMHFASEFEHHPQYSYAGPVLPDQSFDQWEYRTPPAPTPHGLVAPSSPREENTVEVVRMTPPGMSQPSPAGVNPQKMAQMLQIAALQGARTGAQGRPAYYPKPVQPAAPATRPAAKKTSYARPSAPAQRSYSAGPSHTYTNSSVQAMQAQDSKQDYQRAGGTSRTVTGRVMPAPSEIPVSNEPDTLIQTFADQKTGNIIKRYRDRLGKVYDVVVGNASKKNGAPAPASNAPTKAGQPNKPASKPPTAPAQPVQATAPKSTYSTYSAKTSTNVPFSFPNSIPTNEAPSFRLLDDRFVPRSEPPVSPVWGPTPYNELTNAALTALGSLIPASAIKTGVQLLNTANNIGTTLRRVTPEMKAGRRAVNDVRDAYRTATQRAREQKDASDVIEWFNKQNK